MGLVGGRDASTFKKVSAAANVSLLKQSKRMEDLIARSKEAGDKINTRRSEC